MFCLAPVQFELEEAGRSSCAESVKIGHLELQPAAPSLAAHFTHFVLFPGDGSLFSSENISSLH